jgi:SHS2 domain-containing protein
LKFEIIEHTADTGIRAYGTSISEVFINCALGMMSLIVDPGSVRPSSRVSLRAEGRDRESLLVCWLAEIIFQIEVGGWVFCEFGVSELSELHVEGWGLGEPLDLARHVVELEIKAATYHMLEVKDEGGCWTAQVILDV